MPNILDPITDNVKLCFYGKTETPVHTNYCLIMRVKSLYIQRPFDASRDIMVLWKKNKFYPERKVIEDGVLRAMALGVGYGWRYLH